MSLPKLDQLKTLFQSAKVDFKKSALAIINAVSEELENYLPKSGGEITGTLSVDEALTAKKTINATGNITGNYVTGTWLKTTEATEASAVSKVAILDNSGWVYYRTFDHFKEDLGTIGKIEVKTTLLQSGWKDDDYSIDLSTHGLKGDETYLVGVDFSASEEAKEEFIYTGIEGKSQSTSGIVLHCQTAPIEDIPVVITIIGKVKG